MRTCLGFILFWFQFLVDPSHLRVLFSGAPFEQYGLNQLWISIYYQHELWDEITCLFPNFNEKKASLTWFLDWKTFHWYEFFHVIYQFYGLNATGFLILQHVVSSCKRCLEIWLSLWLPPMTQSTCVWMGKMPSKLLHVKKNVTKIHNHYDLEGVMILK